MRSLLLVLCAALPAFAQDLQATLSVGKSFLSQLEGQLSPKAQILSDRQSLDFHKKLSRWTDLKKETPGAIVAVSNEQDIITTVLLAIKHNIPFVPAAHGHSPYSTIGRDGIIIDTLSYANISINQNAQTATITPGVVNRELIAALDVYGLITSLGGSDVGTFSNLLGGGLSGTSSVFGFGSDQILSARILTGAGKVLTVSRKENADLFYGIRGAGTYFGFVLELTIQAYPSSLLDKSSTGNETGTFWSGTAIFPGERFSEAVKVLIPLINKKNAPAPYSGVAIVTTIPGLGVVGLFGFTWFGSSKSAEKFFASIRELEPLVWEGVRAPYNTMFIGNEAYDAKGDFKRFRFAGLEKVEYDEKAFDGIYKSYTELVEKAPDAVNSAWGFEFSVDKLLNSPPDTAWAHRDVKIWMETLTWYTNPKARSIVDRLEDSVLDRLTKKTSKKDVHIYQNFDRSSSLENRFGGSSRIKNLKELKKYDPEGLFTKVFLGK